jgi:triphosphoribosyl-dephospho-CoA synthase
VTAEQIAARAVLAALVEAAAAKPGNVSPSRPARDACFADFASAALATQPALAAAARGPGVPGGLAVGAAVRAAAEASRAAAPTNTNLGIVLLLVPLARAAALVPAPAGRVPAAPLRRALERVLADLTVDDARAAYAAIRLAGPGGLGRADAQDVAGEPTVTLREAMRLAAHRDDVAREYAEGYPTTFELGLPALRRHAGLGPERAAVQAALEILAARPDTLIARKAGVEAARAVGEEAGAVLAAGGVRTREGRRRLAALDRTLRRARGRLNPGTTADLVAASLFVWFLEEGRVGGEAASPTHRLRRRGRVV